MFCKSALKRAWEIFMKFKNKNHNKHMANRLFIANWKMQLLPGEAIKLVKEIVKELGAGVEDTEIVIAPAHDATAEVGEVLRGSKLILGAQDCFWEDRGAYTGEVSPLELKELGCKYVIVGHSERREYLGETDEMVTKKLRAVLRAGMVAVLCVGETREQRENRETEKVLTRELNSALQGLTFRDGHLIVAYEPIWAIGAGIPAKPEDIRSAHGFIRASLDRVLGGKSREARIIYGGSVDGENMPEILRVPDVSGALVGGASLNVESFSKIVQSL